MDSNNQESREENWFSCIFPCNLGTYFYSWWDKVQVWGICRYPFDLFPRFKTSPSYSRVSHVSKRSFQTAAVFGTGGPYEGDHIKKHWGKKKCICYKVVVEDRKCAFGTQTAWKSWGDRYSFLLIVCANDGGKSGHSLNGRGKEKGCVKGHRSLDLILHVFPPRKISGSQGRYMNKKNYRHGWLLNGIGSQPACLTKSG